MPLPGRAPARGASLAAFAAAAAARSCDSVEFTGVIGSISDCRAEANLAGEAKKTEELRKCTCTEVQLYDQQCTSYQCRATRSFGDRCQTYEASRSDKVQECIGDGVNVGENTPMPCTGPTTDYNSREACRSSMLVTGVVDGREVIVESSEWKEALMTEGWEQRRCDNTKVHCYRQYTKKHAACDGFLHCLPRAGQCTTLATVKAFGGFTTAACQAYVQCKIDNIKHTCAATYGKEAHVPNPAGGDDLPCEIDRYCSAAARSKDSFGCAGRSATTCNHGDEEDECEWDWTTKRCWDKPSDRALIETILMSISAGVIGCILMICMVYSFFVLASKDDTSFDQKQQRLPEHDMEAMGSRLPSQEPLAPGSQPGSRAPSQVPGASRSPQQ